MASDICFFKKKEEEEEGRQRKRNTASPQKQPGWLGRGVGWEWDALAHAF